MSVPSAKVIADSVSPEGRRLTTFEVRTHRLVLAEFNTHRVFSRNSASSRAIPVRKQIQRVKEDLAWPVSWPAEQRGMQGGDTLAPDLLRDAKDEWESAARGAAYSAERLSELGLHKSLCNRIIEPFMWHTIVVSATAWQNFLRQRISPLAQPEIRVAAEAIFNASASSTPKLLAEGEWHLPYVSDEDWEETSGHLSTLKAISCARCARVSYLTHDGKRSIDADYELYRKLCMADPMHASPLEHVATPDHTNEHAVDVRLYDETVGWLEKTFVLPRVGNFLGWRQHRLEVELMRDIQSFA